MSTTEHELDCIKLDIDMAVAEGEPTITLTVEDARWLVDMAEKVIGYYELLYQVGQTYPGETRHTTALRYIREAENRNHPTCKELQA